MIPKGLPFPTSLLDMDTFYISVSLLFHQELKDEPVAITRGKRKKVIISPNYGARFYHIRAGMYVEDALELYPDLILLNEEMNLYNDYSRMIGLILRENVPIVEDVPYSKDEWYLFWDVRDFDELKSEAERVRRLVEKSTKLEVTIGNSYNRTLAKLACDIAKERPGKYKKNLVIKPNDLEELVYPLSVRRLCGIGKVKQGRLNNIGIRTIGEFSKASKKQRSTFDGKMRVLYSEIIYPVSFQIPFEFMYDLSLLEK